MKTALIIGGGITGMTALYQLTKFAPDWNILLAEKSKQLGGKIRTIRNGSFIMEAGADSIVARNEGVLPLIKELDLLDELVYNETGVSYIYAENQLHKIPEETVFGIPASIEALQESTLISESGKKEALKDFDKAENPFGPDDSAGDFLTYYLGKEIVEKQIAPVLSGVYSGKLSNLTMKSTLPFLLDYKNKYGSIIKGFSENKKTFFGEQARKKFVSFRNGLDTLIERLAEKSPGAQIFTETSAVRIQQTNNRYTVFFAEREPVEADYVVLAVPHDAAQKILGASALEVHFNKLKNTSLTSVYLGFSVPDACLPADGTGFIAAENSDLFCDACTWTSRKWTHTSPDRNLLVRLFYKSTNPHYKMLEPMNEEQLIKTALSDIEKSLGITQNPQTANVTQWKNLMPNYHLQHGQAVSSLTETVEKTHPNLFLAGCSYFGVGIGACIQNGKKTAFTILQNGNITVKE